MADSTNSDRCRAMAASQRALSDDDLQAAVTLHRGGMSGSAIARQFHCSQTTACEWLRRCGVTARTRRYQLNEAAFDDLRGNHLGQYVIGLLLADGWVCQRPSKGSCVGLALSGEDGPHVGLFRDFIGTDQPVRIRRPNSQYPNAADRHSLEVNSVRLVKAVGRYGVLPRKSKTARLLKYQDSAAVWCGIVCGDGWVTVRRGVPVVGLIGSKACLAQYQGFLRRRLGLDYCINSDGRGNFFTEVESRRAALIVNLLFRDCPFALPRKKRAADEILARHG
jgi:hypothetical protein